MLCEVKLDEETADPTRSGTHGSGSDSVQDLADLIGQGHGQGEVVQVWREIHPLLPLDPLDLLLLELTVRAVHS